MELPAFLNSIPTNRSMVGFAVSALDRDITDERFLHGTAAEISISQPVHQAEVEIINVITREAGAGCGTQSR